MTAHVCTCGGAWRWRLDYLEHLAKTGHAGG